MMLFFVFLKIDALEIIEKMRNFKLMIYISLVYMIIIPLLFFCCSTFLTDSWHWESFF